MNETVLDLEEHEDDSLWGVWKRRTMFVVLIALCITMAAPSFGSCSDAFGVSATQTEGVFTMGGERVIISVSEFGSTAERLRLTRAMLSQGRGGNVEDEDVWRHIMLNHVALEAGVHVSPGTVTRFLTRYFGQDGKLDEESYRSQLKQASDGRLNHETFSRTIEELMRLGQYQDLYSSTMGQVAAEDAFEQWQEENDKLTVEYVVQPHGPLEEEVEKVDPTDEQLKTYMSLPKVKKEFEVPASRVIETAYVLAGDVSEEQRRAMEGFVVDRKLATPDDVKAQAWQVFWDGRESHFTRRNWIKLQEPAYKALKAAYDTEIAAWNEMDPEKRPAKPVAPADPALIDYPKEPGGQFKDLWGDPVSKEILGRLVLKTLAEEAARESKSFAALLPTYAPLGVQVVQNETSLPEDEIAAEYPLELAKDSSFLVAVRQNLKGPSDDRPFTPEVHEEPVPTTNSSTRIARRGYMVLRLAEFVPPRQLELEEARERAVELWRKDEAIKRARDRLVELEARVRKGDISLDDGAEELGLSVRVLRRFNRNTKEPREPTVPAGEEATPEFEAAIDRIRYRNRVQRYYGLLRTDTAPGSFYKQVLSDPRTGAAYLMRLVSKEKPLHMEMSPTDLAVARRRLQASQQGWERDLLGYEALAEKLQLETVRAKRDAEAKEKEQAESDS